MRGPDLQRRAELLALVTGFAERAERVPVMADLALRLDLAPREVRRQMMLLEKDGSLTVERRGSGMSQSLRIILPGGVLASAWSPTWEPKGESRTGTRRVLALLTEAAQTGGAVPTNKEIAAMLGLGRGAVQSSLNNLASIGRIKIHRTGGSHDGTRQVEIDGMRSAASPRSPAPVARGERAVPNVIAGMDPPRPNQPIVARRLPRCPMCELPAGHHLCRHGWNGQTTRGQRRMIATAAGLYGRPPATGSRESLS